MAKRFQIRSGHSFGRRSHVSRAYWGLRHAVRLATQYGLVAAVALTLGVFDTPNQHQHSPAERSLAAHEHFAPSEGGSRQSCADATHLHSASVKSHESCPACLRTFHRVRAPGRLLMAGVFTPPNSQGIELLEGESTRRAATGIPPGRAPPLT